MVFRISFGSRGKRESEAAKEAFQVLNGELARIPFEASDPASVEAAIAKAEATIDDKMAPWRDNRLVIPVVKEVKEKIRRQLLAKARGGAGA